MSFSKRQGNDVDCYTKPLDSLKSWNDHFFWVDTFACLASFLWNTSKSVSKDPFPRSFEFNAEHYATLVAYPAPFHKYPEPFLCLVGISRNYTLDKDTYPQFLHENGEEIDLLSFIQTANPTKVRVGERQHAEDEPRLLDTTMGRVVPLLPISPARAESELDASVHKLFDEGGNGNQAEQGDSASGGHGVGIQLVSEAPKAEVRGEPIPTLPFVTSSVSATPERKDEAHTDSATGLNLRTIGAPQVATTITSTFDPAITVKEKFVKSFIFCGDSSGGGADYTPGGFSDLTGSDFIIGGIRTVISPNTDLQEIRFLTCLVNLGGYGFDPPKFFALIRGMKHDQLFTEFNFMDQEVADLDARVTFAKSHSNNFMDRVRLHEHGASLLGFREKSYGRIYEGFILTALRSSKIEKMKEVE
ncbi:hypothetical protein Tco_0007367 [Tanacetum coccineum]